MTSQFHLMCPDTAMKLVQQRQAELAAQFEKQSAEQATHSRFVRLDLVRRLLSRLVPRFGAHM